MIKQHEKSKIFYSDEDKSFGSSLNSAYYFKDYGDLPVKFPIQDKVVMDCGANIGCFSVRIMELGAKYVHCYEPNETCVELLKLNLQSFPNSTIVQAALIGSDEEKELDFYYKESLLEASTLRKKQSRFHYKTTRVKGISFWAELERIRPQILKIDIEGEEWNLLTKQIPDFVEVLIAEFHGSKDHPIHSAEEVVKKSFPNSTNLARHYKRFFNQDRLYVTVETRLL